MRKTRMRQDLHHPRPELRDVLLDAAGADLLEGLEAHLGARVSGQGDDDVDARGGGTQPQSIALAQRTHLVEAGWLAGGVCRTVEWGAWLGALYAWLR